MPPLDLFLLEGPFRVTMFSRLGIMMLLAKKLQVVRPGAPSSVLAPSSDARSPRYLLVVGARGSYSTPGSAVAPPDTSLPPHLDETKGGWQ